MDCGGLDSKYGCPGQKTTNVLNADAVVNLLVSTLKVTTTLLPTGTNGVLYTTCLAAGGGQAPYT